MNFRSFLKLINLNGLALLSDKNSYNKLQKQKISTQYVDYNYETG